MPEAAAGDENEADDEGEGADEDEEEKEERSPATIRTEGAEGRARRGACGRLQQFP